MGTEQVRVSAGVGQARRVARTQSPAPPARSPGAPESAFTPFRGMDAAPAGWPAAPTSFSRDRRIPIEAHRANPTQRSGQRRTGPARWATTA
jgi:hypothetical protein